MAGAQGGGCVPTYHTCSVALHLSFPTRPGAENVLLPSCPGPVPLSTLPPTSQKLGIGPQTHSEYPDTPTPSSLSQYMEKKQSKGLVQRREPGGGREEHPKAPTGSHQVLPSLRGPPGHPGRPAGPSTGHTGAAQNTQHLTRGQGQVWRLNPAAPSHLPPIRVTSHNTTREPPAASRPPGPLTRLGGATYAHCLL